MIDFRRGSLIEEVTELQIHLSVRPRTVGTLSSNLFPKTMSSMPARAGICRVRTKQSWKHVQLDTRPSDPSHARSTRQAVLVPNRFVSCRRRRSRRRVLSKTNNVTRGMMCTTSPHPYNWRRRAGRPLMFLPCSGGSHDGGIQQCRGANCGAK